VKRERRRGYAVTAPDARDAALRGRTYAVPFDLIWREALLLTGGGLRRWTVTEADDQEGVILACARSIGGAMHDVMITITLDADGQTRVDASAQARKPLSDFGRSARRLRRFFHALDRALQRRATQPHARPSG
jgi:hypothetical protein